MYEADTTSRGYRKWNGCASCVHRNPHNATTEIAERAFEDARRKKEKA
jgi:hypothetical protein